MHYRFGVIGLGRVGCAMMTLLREAGHTPVWAVTSRDAPFGVRTCRTIPGDPSGAQVVLIAVPDGLIAGTALDISRAWGPGCAGIVFLHFSGLLPSSVLDALEAHGAFTGSMHPLQSIVDAAIARRAITQSVFTFEGSAGAREAAEAIAGSLGVPMLDIRASDKTLYHASAVVASNHLVALIHQASSILEGIGMEERHLMGLIRGTLSNVERLGTRAALTGPVSRGDWETVKAHMRALGCLFPDIAPGYLELARYASSMAGTKMPAEVADASRPEDLGDLLERLGSMRDRGMRVVFTNGCFDILHAGHVAYLSKARALGDFLVVGLNSDESVRRLKGPARPVNGQDARKAMLEALRCVDFVAVFEEDTPIRLIGDIRPDVLVKGGDWLPENIVGADLVQARGGRVVTVDFEEGFSTTGIIDRIRGG
jgi:rfaE bifunctional protein nucleotidyltransferase chain/domain